MGCAVSHLWRFVCALELRCCLLRLGAASGWKSDAQQARGAVHEAEQQHSDAFVRKNDDPALSI